ncbi:MAG: hypothetical protein LBQ20_05665 [Rhodanobacter sp.]|jgi:hypothetical protein|nr:hypothetical protein [Rhodanobacter sp.]
MNTHKTLHATGGRLVSKDRPRPWYLRRIDGPDLLRGCKTGEVIEPTPLSLTRKIIYVTLALAATVIIFPTNEWFKEVWLPHFLAEVDALAKTDPALADLKGLEFGSLVMLVPMLTGIVMCMAGVIGAFRVMRAGRWPLPGAKVQRRMEVVAGWWCVRLPASIFFCFFLAGTFFLGWSYTQVLDMAWNRYLDRRIEAAFKPHHQRPPPHAAAVPATENGVTP